MTQTFRTKQKNTFEYKNETHTKIIELGARVLTIESLKTVKHDAISNWKDESHNQVFTYIKRARIHCGTISVQKRKCHKRKKGKYRKFFEKWKKDTNMEF